MRALEPLLRRFRRRKYEVTWSGADGGTRVSFYKAPSSAHALKRLRRETPAAVVERIIRVP
jgi:hypothetical protein